MSKLYFTISEFLIDKSLTHVPVHVADKILKHISIINPIRIKLGIAIRVSKSSGYRPYDWELKEEDQAPVNICLVKLLTSKIRLCF